MAFAEACTAQQSRTIASLDKVTTNNHAHVLNIHYIHLLKRLWAVWPQPTLSPLHAHMRMSTTHTTNPTSRSSAVWAHALQGTPVTHRGLLQTQKPQMHARKACNAVHTHARTCIQSVQHFKPQQPYGMQAPGCSSHHHHTDTHMHSQSSSMHPCIHLITLQHVLPSTRKSYPPQHDQQHNCSSSTARHSFTQTLNHPAAQTLNPPHSIQA